MFMKCSLVVLLLTNIYHLTSCKFSLLLQSTWEPSSLFKKLLQNVDINVIFNFRIFVFLTLITWHAPDHWYWHTSIEVSLFLSMKLLRTLSQIISHPDFYALMLAYMASTMTPSWKCLGKHLLYWLTSKHFLWMETCRGCLQWKWAALPGVDARKDGALVLFSMEVFSH